MSSFEVDFSRIKTKSSDILTISRMIDSLMQQLDRCNGTLSYCLSPNSYSSIKKSIVATSKSIEQQSGYLRRLSSGLEQIANTYSSAESAIKSGKPTFSEIMKALSGNALKLLTGGSLSDSVISGSLARSTELFGVATSGAISGSLLGYELKGTNEWKFKRNENGKWTDASAEVGFKGSVYGAKGKAEVNVGLAGLSAEASLLNASASGAIGASLFKNGKLSPALTAELKAKANVAEGSAKAQFGNKDYNVHGKAEGKVLGAEAEAKAAAGVITYKDKAGNEVSAAGVQAKAGAEVYAAKGSISGGFTIFGVKIDASIEGKAGALGAEASGQITTNGVSGSIGASALLGVGLNVSVDWTEAADNISKGLEEAGKAISKGWSDFTSGVSKFKLW